MPWVKLVLYLWEVLGHHCPDIYIQCDSFGIAAGISMSVVLTVFTNSTVTIKEGDPKIHLNSNLNFTVKKQETRSGTVGGKNRYLDSLSLQTPWVQIAMLGT